MKFDHDAHWKGEAVDPVSDGANELLLPLGELPSFTSFDSDSTFARVEIILSTFVETIFRFPFRSCFIE